MKSIEEVAQWLETLPDLTVDAELVKTHEALVVVREEQPAQKKAWPPCKAWGQAVKRKQKPLTLPVVTAELRENVLAASNQVKKRLAQVMRSSASSAEQPVRDIGSPGTEPPSKRLRAAEPERSKRELERAPGEDGLPFSFPLAVL